MGRAFDPTMLVTGILFALVLLLLWLQFADRDAGLFLSKTFNRQDPQKFLNKVVWITGASQGLGRLLALHFAKRGAKLILSSRSAERLKVVAEECGGDPDRFHILPFDLREANWEEVASVALSSFPEGLDYIIQNVGLSQHSPAVETKPYIVESMFQLNTIGSIALTQALLPGLLKQGKGHIVTIASMAGKIPSPGQAIYASTKFAVVGYFNTLRTELAASPLDVTVCCPGPIKFRGKGGTRDVYHGEGLVKEQLTRSTGLDANKVTRLVALAAEHRLGECWMAKQPILLLAYLTQYTPRIASYILNRIGPRRAKAVKRGDGYSMDAVLGRDKSQ